MSTPETVPVIPQVIPARNPFVGPRPIERGDLIFGRDAEIEQLYFLLSAERVVLLHSPSGAGKSSLIQAGLIPRLASHFDHWGPVRVNLHLPPDADPSLNRYIRSAILGFESELPERLRRPESEIAALTLSQYLAGRTANLRRRNAPENTVLIFDQFEEILTVDPLALEAKTAFFAQLGALLQEDPHLWALFVIREDFLAPLDPYAHLLPTHLKTRFRLDLFTRTAAAESIEKSVEAAGRTVDPVALVTLVSDLAMMQVQQPDGSFLSQPGPYVEPLHLQVACRNLWDRLSPAQTVIQPHDLDSFGGVTQALSDFYATEVQKVAALDSHPDLTERGIRDWIGTRLITRGDIRTQVLRETGSSGGLDNTLIERLVQTHLVRAEQRAGATWYELSHDRLIRPIRASNRLWFEAHLSTLQKTAALWVDQGEAPGLLLIGHALREAQAWASANADALEDIERTFLAKSLEKQHALDRERRYVRRLRVFFLVAVITAIAAGTAAVYAYLESRKASVAAAQSALSNVSQRLLQPAADPIAIAQAARAYRLDPASLDAHAWVTDALVRRGWWLPRTLFGAGEKLLTADLSADARRVATLSPDGAAQLWDASTGAAIGPPMPYPSAFSMQSGVVPLLGFSLNGHRIAVAVGKTAQLWDADISKPIGPPIQHDGDIVSIAFSWDSRRFATLSADHRASIWDAVSGIKLADLQHQDTVNYLDFARDGSRIVTASDDGSARIWDGKTYKPIGPPLTPPAAPGGCGPIHSAQFNRDASRIVTTCFGQADLWLTGAAAQLVHTFKYESEDVNGASFSPTANRLVIASSDETAAVWDLDATEFTHPSMVLQHETSVFFASFTEDGARILTGSDDHQLQVWNAATGAPIGGAIVNDAALINVGSNLNGTAILTVTDGHPAVLWTFDPPRRGNGDLVPHPGVILDFIRGTLISSVDGKTALITDAEGKSIGVPIPVGSLVDGKTFTLSDAEGKSTGVPIPAGGASGAALTMPLTDLTADRSRLLTYIRAMDFKAKPGNPRFRMSSVQLWDTATGKRVGPLLPDSDSELLSPDSTLLLLSDGDLLHTVDLKTGAMLPASFRHSYLQSSSFSPADHTIATSYFGGTRLWNGLTGQTGKELPHLGSVNDAQFSADGKLVVTSNRDRTAQVWNVASGATVGNPLSVPFEVLTSQFGADASTLTTVAGDCQTQVWDTQSGLRRGPATHLSAELCKPGSVNSVNFTPDGRTVFVGSRQAAQLWDPLTGKAIGEPISAPPPVPGALPPPIVGSFPTPDGHQALVGYVGGDLKIARYLLFLDPRPGDSKDLLSTLVETVAGERINPATGAAESILPEDRVKTIQKLRLDFHIPQDTPLLQFFIDRFSRSSPAK